jgi:2,3-bisphosphoglycerate-independent phosphoglycerate mutase
MEKKSPTALIILDGFGLSTEEKYNAIAQANKPAIDFFLSNYPHAAIQASGKAVGLPDSYMGNSEVGHITIGAGRITPSPFMQMHTALHSGALEKNLVLVTHLHQLAQTNNTLHLMGLLSDSGVNSHTEIIKSILLLAQSAGIKKIIIHAFLDGRDTAPQAAEKFLSHVDHLLKQFPTAHVGSITGRYYAMDRDNHWDRTEKMYTMLTDKEKKIVFHSWQEALNHYYSQKIFDEFIPPTLLNENATIRADDGIIMFNFRPDRARQLTACFVLPEKVPFAPKIHTAFCITPTQFENDFKNPVLFETKPLINTLKEILSKYGKTIFAIAETEKYAHVTYFFSGGRETSFPGEQQVLIHSLAVKSYAEHPCMSAVGITNAIIESLHKKPADFYLVNYANADMVGHSGNLAATIKAIECLDAQLKILYEEIVKKMGGTIIITADHGNAEKKYDDKIGQPWTAHTSNPVPFIVIKKELKGSKIELPVKELADVAPFILEQMGLPVPKEMQGN